MEIFNNILYLEVSELEGFAIPISNIWQSCARYRKGDTFSWENIPHPKDARKVLINYDTIPSSTLIKYNVPSKEEFVAEYGKRVIKEAVKINPADLDWYLNNRTAHGFAHEYAKISAWLLFCASQKRKDVISKGFEGLDDFYKSAIVFIQDEGFKTLKVSNLQHFKRLLKPFNQWLKNKLSKDDALESVISKKFGKKNAEKLKQEQKDLLEQIHGDPKKPSFEQTYTIYLNRATEKITFGEWTEKAIVSRQAIINYLETPEVKQRWFAARHGWSEWRQVYDPVTKRIAPSFANALWVMDGTPWHCYYMDGKSAYARLNVFPILDAYSWCVIGFSVDFAETSNMVTRALLGACQRSGVVPYQLQYDNSAAIKSYQVQEAVSKLVKYNTATQVGNARAKIIEPFFRHFNDQVLKFFPGYTGSNITAKKLDSKANREELQRLVKVGAIPNMETALKQMAEAFMIWNRKPFKGDLSPLERYERSFKETRERQRYFTQMMQVDAFWEMPGEMKKIKTTEQGKVKTLQHFKPELYLFSNKGIRIERSGKQYDFDVEDAVFRSENIGRRFSVKYDPAKMDTLYLYDNGKIVADHAGNIVCAKDKTSLHMAIADREAGEGASFYRLNELRKKQAQLVHAKREEIVSRTINQGLFTPVTHSSLYPKDMINQIKASSFEELINVSELAEKSIPIRYNEEINEGIIEEPQKTDNKINRWE